MCRTSRVRTSNSCARIVGSSRYGVYVFDANAMRAAAEWELHAAGAHRGDVSYYVRPGSAIDNEAQMRARRKRPGAVPELLLRRAP
jgi:hypothetical protein